MTEDEPADAAEGLRQIEKVKASIAHRARLPLWYHLALAAIVTVAVASMMIPHHLGALVGIALIGIGLLLQKWAIQRLGFSFPWRFDREAWVFIGIAIAGMIVGRVSVDHGLWWVPAPIGAALGALTLYYSLHAEKKYRRELTGPVTR